MMMLLLVGLAWMVVLATLLRRSRPTPADRSRERFLKLQLLADDRLDRSTGRPR